MYFNLIGQIQYISPSILEKYFILSARDAVCVGGGEKKSGKYTEILEERELYLVTIRTS